jgi:hypothetical protein
MGQRNEVFVSGGINLEGEGVKKGGMGMVMCRNRITRIIGKRLKAK